MHKISKLTLMAALLTLVGCASNPPQEPKHPPTCQGTYTPINTPDHYPALARGKQG